MVLVNTNFTIDPNLLDAVLPRIGECARGMLTPNIEGRLIRGIKVTVEIPKVSSPQQLNEFCPISLIGCIYKVVAKLLAIRLQPVLAKVIDERQYAFIGGRNMLDSVMVVNEVVHEAKIRKRPTLIYKVVYDIAYDSVYWDFLEYMMRRMEFSEKWIGWIMGCLKSATVSVLVNGSPGRKFRGYLVGDSLDIDVSLLQFADDTIFIGEASIQNLVVLKSILRCFELCSGLKVNFHKSKLATVAVGVGVASQFVSFLNCKVMDIPFVYLGIPVGARPSCQRMWEPVINKIKNRLSSWKQKLISFGGCICLIQSVLSSLPLFFLSFFKMPLCVAKICTRLIRNFLWEVVKWSGK
ncbi:uncharacterized protein LOC130732451 [Lotus japonicus]|uniref:uncharacterized protein LOC130732451 n=1 Tax=Lotus japonicus TaxID=34305 RepID=UPI002586A947|nr:uncharacterized protein LOC130732451 [Lotus japonicus]